MSSYLQSLLRWDTQAFERAQTLVDPIWSRYIQIAGEAVVAFGAFLLVALWLFGTFKKREFYKVTALSIFYTIALIFILYAFINLGLSHWIQWRPGAMTISGARALIPHPTDNSFPSGHALFVGALLVGLFRFFRRTWLVSLVLILSVITLSARVVGGVHYPGDILGGLFFGIAGSVILAPVVDILVKKTAPFFIKVASKLRL